MTIQVVDGAMLNAGDGESGGDQSATDSLTLLAVLGRRGVAVIVLIVCATAVVVIAFLLATVCLLRRRRRHRYRKADGIPFPSSSCNGEKYNCRVEALRALKQSAAAGEQVSPPACTEVVDRSAEGPAVIRTFDCRPRTPAGRVVLVVDGSDGAATGNGGLNATAVRWNQGAGGREQSCRRQLLPAAPPDLVTRVGSGDRAMSTFGKTLPPAPAPPAKRTLSTSDVISATPDIKV